jgi:hypothetical protein
LDRWKWYAKNKDFIQSNDNRIMGHYNINNCNCHEEPQKELCQPQPCGCDFEVDARCVRVSRDLPCVGTASGQTLEEVLLSVDTKLCNIQDGDDGLSAYEIAVGQGFEGTEEEWIESLQGADGECDCERTVLYEELVELSGETNVGIWSGPISVLPTSPLAVPAFSYTVPVGGAGLYEVMFNAVYVLSELEDNAIYTDLAINGVLHPNAISISSATTTKDPFKSFSLFSSEIPLAEGDTIDFRVASTNTIHSRLLFLKYKLTKLS